MGRWRGSRRFIEPIGGAVPVFDSSLQVLQRIMLPALLLALHRMIGSSIADFFEDNRTVCHDEYVSFFSFVHLLHHHSVRNANRQGDKEVSSLYRKGSNSRKLGV
ncbi:hypothetical protein ZIOFF_004729 [Zingiber officinale]|uniref:Uncharacterized protein n=1 Tax=Zingiber officinale TaxID=94328 RepID=A0A8J5IB98_ZINOF|nr:hypothetical protein ZIOFF_004729 [Zingiber officinale]